MVAAVAGLGLGALTRVPYTEHRADDAMVRLAWKFRSDRVRACRRLSAAELAKLPAHMRAPEVCEGALRPYALEVAVDGTPRLASDTVKGAGVSGDRPLFVFRELALAPGRHRLAVRFTPLGPDSTRPAGLSLDTVVTLGVRDVVLVTLDDTRGVLTARRSF